MAKICKTFGGNGRKSHIDPFTCKYNQLIIKRISLNRNTFHRSLTPPQKNFPHFPRFLHLPHYLFCERGKKALFSSEISCILILGRTTGETTDNRWFQSPRKRQVWISTFNPQAPSAANNQYWHQGPRRQRGVVICQHRGWGTPLLRKGW